MKKRSVFIKNLALILSGVCVFPLLVACNGSGSEKTTTTSETTTTETVPEEPKEYSLEGKKFLFLGSSVTYGSASGGVSFADFIAENNNCTSVKYAVSGTTLVDSEANSYVFRLTKQAGKKEKDIDHVIVQLSTNDATKNKPLGKLTEGKDSLENYDTDTVIGAIEYIIHYSTAKWGCKVSFYTGTKYDSPVYKKMVDALYDIQKKWDIGIIDLWNDPEMNAISKNDYNKYMSDSIHPNKLGYEEWWTPKFEAYLKQFP